MWVFFFCRKSVKMFIHCVSVLCHTLPFEAVHSIGDFFMVFHFNPQMQFIIVLTQNDDGRTRQKHNNKEQRWTEKITYRSVSFAVYGVSLTSFLSVSLLSIFFNILFYSSPFTPYTQSIIWLSLIEYRGAPITSNKNKLWLLINWLCCTSSSLSLSLSIAHSLFGCTSFNSKWNEWQRVQNAREHQLIHFNLMRMLASV